MVRRAPPLTSSTSLCLNGPKEPRTLFLIRLPLRAMTRSLLCGHTRKPEHMDEKTAKQLGEQAGHAAAIRWETDPEWFEETPNPFGIDSEPDLWEAWQEAYEGEFELKR